MKLICIKEEDIEERDDTEPIIFGEIYEGDFRYDTSPPYSYSWLNEWRIKIPDSQFYKIYSLEHFTPLAEYRENRLNFLLDDDHSER